jgi:agmatinase
VVQLDLKQLNDEASCAMQALRQAQDCGGDTGGAQHTVETACHGVDTLLGEALHEAWANHCAVLVVGGDHGSVYAGMHEALGRWPELGVLQIDAHADRRAAYEGIAASHASVMHRLRAAHPKTPFTQVGLRDLHPTERDHMDADPATTPFYDEALVQQQFLGMPWAEQARAIIASLPPQVWLTLDVDGLDPSLCPHTGTPVPGGLSFYQTCDLIERIKTSGRQLVGADLCEVAGEPWDANVGSRLVYRLLAALL